MEVDFAPIGGLRLALQSAVSSRRLADFISTLELADGAPTLFDCAEAVADVDGAFANAPPATVADIGDRLLGTAEDRAQNERTVTGALCLLHRLCAHCDAWRCGRLRAHCGRRLPPVVAELLTAGNPAACCYAALATAACAQCETLYADDTAAPGPCSQWMRDEAAGVVSALRAAGHGHTAAVCLLTLAAYPFAGDLPQSWAVPASHDCATEHCAGTAACIRAQLGAYLCASGAQLLPAVGDLGQVRIVAEWLRSASSEDGGSGAFALRAALSHRRLGPMVAKVIAVLLVRLCGLTDLGPSARTKSFIDILSRLAGERGSDACVECDLPQISDVYAVLCALPLRNAADDTKAVLLAAGGVVLAALLSPTVRCDEEEEIAPCVHMVLSCSSALLSGTAAGDLCERHAGQHAAALCHAAASPVCSWHVDALLRPAIRGGRVHAGHCLRLLVAGEPYGDLRATASLLDCLIDCMATVCDDERARQGLLVVVETHVQHALALAIDSDDLPADCLSSVLRVARRYRSMSPAGDGNGAMDEVEQRTAALAGRLLELDAGDELAAAVYTQWAAERLAAMGGDCDARQCAALLVDSVRLLRRRPKCAVRLVRSVPKSAWRTLAAGMDAPEVVSLWQCSFGNAAAPIGSARVRKRAAGCMRAHWLCIEADGNIGDAEKAATCLAMLHFARRYDRGATAEVCHRLTIALAFVDVGRTDDLDEFRRVCSLCLDCVSSLLHHCPPPSLSAAALCPVLADLACATVDRCAGGAHSPGDTAALKAVCRALGRTHAELAGHKQAFAKPAAHLLSAFVTRLHSVGAVPSDLRSALLPVAYSLLDLCDRRAIAFLAANLHVHIKPVFAALYTDYNEYHRYKGLV